MCTSQRWIWNKYDNKPYLVECGHCPACLQGKANLRAAKITKEFSIPGHTCFFLTLTYNNDVVPYLKPSEFQDFIDTGLLNVYRGDKIIYQLTPDDFVSYGKEYDISSILGKRYPYLRRYIGHSRYGYLNDRVGVLWYPDLQKFIKRLKKNLVCKYNYEDYFSWYICGEYGESYYRPHFHALIFCSEQHAEVIRSAVVSAWKYSDLNKKALDKFGNWRQGIEYAKSPAHYVASYVNCSSNVPDLLSKAKPFRPRYKTSHGFATNFKFFSYEAIKEAFYRGALEYPVYVTKAGKTSLELAKIPKYALSRYFPYFKGINRLSPDELFLVLQRPSEIRRFSERCQLEPEDIHKIIVQINHKKGRCYSKGYKQGNIAEVMSDFIFVGSHIWSLFKSTNLKYSYKDVFSDFDLLDHFVNLDDFIKSRRHNTRLLHNSALQHALRSCFGCEYLYHPELEIDPNRFRRVVAQTTQNEKMYEEKIKQRNVYDLYYSNLNENSYG